MLTYLRVKSAVLLLLMQLMDINDVLSLTVSSLTLFLIMSLHCKCFDHHIFMFNHRMWNVKILPRPIFLSQSKNYITHVRSC